MHTPEQAQSSEWSMSDEQYRQALRNFANAEQEVRQSQEEGHLHEQSNSVTE